VSFSIGKLLHHIELCAASRPGQFPEPVVEAFDDQGLAAIQRNAGRPNYMRDSHTLNRMNRSFQVNALRS
jgi:hypothetical protein